MAKPTTRENDATANPGFKTGRRAAAGRRRSNAPIGSPTHAALSGASDVHVREERDQ
jgi:hypothetical protein